MTLQALLMSSCGAVKDVCNVLPILQELINKAILASVAARREWDLKPVQDRAQILFKAADVISGPKRAEILAKTMIGQVELLPQDANIYKQLCYLCTLR